MKVTLRFSAYIPANNSNLFALTPGWPWVNNQHRPANESSSQQLHTVHLASWGCWLNKHPGLTSAHKYTGEAASLITVRKPHLLKFNTYSPHPAVTPALDSATTPPALEPAAHYSDSPDIWLFSATAQQLCNDSHCIALTAIEALLIKTLTRRDERVCSKQELIIGINKDTYSYSGLEMCLSRLQNKFKAVFGERLFRSVRNRGYCIVQDVQIAV